MTRQSQQARILLVDDNDMGRQMVRALLENVGLEVVEARNGQDAIDRVSVEEFDLVLMDMQMPVLSGYSAAQKIRNMGGHLSELPIIAMTADSFSEHRAESLDAGMNSHIDKPIDLGTLYRELTQWLPGNKKPQLDMFMASEVSDCDIFSKLFSRVDVKAGIHRASGDQQLYLDLLNRFVERFSTLEVDLLALLERGEKAEAVRYIHTLKGAAGGLGATALQKMAEKLESQMTHSDTLSTFHNVLKELNFLLTDIKGVLQQNQKTPVKAELAGNRDELITLLKQLEGPLRALQVQQVQQLFDTVKMKEWSQEYHEILAELDVLIEQYQFIPAANLIETFLDQGE